MNAKRTETFFISAGEHSGDLLGADLVLALRERLPKLVPYGVGGSAMANAGVELLAHIDDLGVMGVAEVARRVADFRLQEHRILHWIDHLKPEFAVLVDYPGLHLRLAEQIKMRGIPVFQYVAPKIWAWGSGRAAAIRDTYDKVYGILPFEEDYFRKLGINYEYVGSPVKDRIDKVIVNRAAIGIPANRKVIALLPGSRADEVRKNLPRLQAIRNALVRHLPDALFLVPVARNIAIADVLDVLGVKAENPALVEPGKGSAIAARSVEVAGLTIVHGMSLEVMATADAAVVASGTATLECALLGTPMVVVYTMSELTYQIAKHAVKIPNISLVNLIAGRRLVEEYIQDYSVEAVAREVASLAADGPKRRNQIQWFEDIRDKLQGMAATNTAKSIARQFLD